MSIFKMALLGAAVAYGVSYITKRREDGSTILDDFLEKAPNWMNDAKEFATQTINDVTQNQNNRPQ